MEGALPPGCGAGPNPTPFLLAVISVSLIAGISVSLIAVASVSLISEQTFAVSWRPPLPRCCRLMAMRPHAVPPSCAPHPQWSLTPPRVMKGEFVECA